MALILWNNNMSVNIKQIDEQHKVWVELINSLYDAMKVGQGKVVLEKIIKDVVDYTSFHFNSEEELFKKHGYSETASHKEIHNKFKAEILEMKKKLEGDSSVSAVNVMNQLKDWLTNHIMIHDKKYAIYLNSKGVY